MRGSRWMPWALLAFTLGGCASQTDWKGSQARDDEPMATGTNLPRRRSEAKVVTPADMEKVQGVSRTSANPK